MKKTKNTSKLPVIISAITSSVAVAAVTILIVERKLFSDYLNDLHNLIGEIEKIPFDEPPRDEKPKANYIKSDEWLKIDIPDDSDIDEGEIL